MEIIYMLSLLMVQVAEMCRISKKRVPSTSACVDSLGFTKSYFM